MNFVIELIKIRRKSTYIQPDRLNAKKKCPWRHGCSYMIIIRNVCTLPAFCTQKKKKKNDQILALTAEHTQNKLFKFCYAV